MHHRPALLKNFLARGLLALTFLFAQQTAALHWLSHSVEATQAKTGKKAPLPDHCDECLALSALGAAATSESTPLPLAGGDYALLPTRESAVAPASLRLAFRSRAPPILA